MACVTLSVRPTPVSTTLAPCSWHRRATSNAIEPSVSTPVTRMFLPSRMPMVPPCERLRGQIVRELSGPCPGRRRPAARRRTHSLPHRKPRRRQPRRLPSPCRTAWQGSYASYCLTTSSPSSAVMSVVMNPGAITLAVMPRRAHLARDRPRHADKRRLGRRVVDLARIAHEAHHRADQHDATELLAHHRVHRAPHRAERASEVDVDDGLEVLVRHAHEQPVASDARVRHEHADPPVRRLELVECRVDGIGVRDVRDGARDALGKVPAPIDRRDRVAVRHEGLGDRAADAAVRSCHHHMSSHAPKLADAPSEQHLAAPVTIESVTATSDREARSTVRPAAYSAAPNRADRGDRARAHGYRLDCREVAVGPVRDEVARASRPASGVRASPRFPSSRS